MLQCSLHCVNLNDMSILNNTRDGNTSKKMQSIWNWTRMQTLHPPHSEKKMMNNAEPEINWIVFLNLFKLHFVLHTSKKDVTYVVSCQPMWRLFLKLCHLHIDNYGHVEHEVAFDFNELSTVAGECPLLLILEKERANWILNCKALWRFLQCTGRHLTKRNSSFLLFWRELFRKYNHQIWISWIYIWKTTFQTISRLASHEACLLFALKMLNLTQYSCHFLHYSCHFFHYSCLMILTTQVITLQRIGLNGICNITNGIKSHIHTFNIILNFYKISNSLIEMQSKKLDIF
jgi:hypothetical protein